MLKITLLFILGLVCLIVGGDWFVDGAADIARKYRVPELLIGATIVSIGTTLPEVLVSAEAAVLGHSEIAYGNAIGSIICNTSLIAAITMTIRPGEINKKELFVPVGFFFGSAALYSAVAYISGYFSRLVGILLLVIYVAYMAVSIKSAFAKNKNTDKSNEESTEEFTKKFIVLAIGKLIVGAVLIALGADLLVDNGTLIAEAIGVPESVIGLTFVALGTSLPELVTAITSLIKGHSALSLGNIIGANLFNIVFVSGLATTLSPFKVPASKLIGGLNASFVIDIPVMFIVMIIMTIPSLITGKIKRWQGMLLLAIYASFCVFQFIG